VSHASVIRDRREIPNLIATNKDFRIKTETLFNKARILAREIKAAEEQRRVQEEYDMLFSKLKEEAWYEQVYYVESLMLPA
jgi:predicted Holliday junction resolvase-like endonuclease